MQCNTNYTGNENNLNYINLNVLKTYKKKFPNLILGLSDHTFGHSSVLGAISLGARVIEKHYTLSNNYIGPDHYFSMNPLTWKQMVIASRELESALGDGVKKVEKNELNSKIVQQRSIRARVEIDKSKKISKKDLICLRPKTEKGLEPYHISKLVGKKTKRKILKHQEINWKLIK